MAGRPLVTVLMAVFESERYLDQAVRSLVGQTCRDWELLLLNDGSTDRSGEIAERWRRRDGRIAHIELPHRGISATLNAGIERSHGRYLAIADADDISLPQRLARQVEFLERNPEVGMVGAGGWAIPADRVFRVSATEDRVRCELLFDNVVPHPALMARRAVLDRHGLRYEPEYECAQDYDLIERAAEVTRLANLRDLLIGYRIHGRQCSQMKRERQLEEAGWVRRRQIRRLGAGGSELDLALHESIALGTPSSAPEVPSRATAWFERLIAANRVVSVYPEPAFSTMLGEKLFRVYADFPALRPRDALAYRRFAADLSNSRSWSSVAGLIARSLAGDRLRRVVRRKQQVLRT